MTINQLLIESTKKLSKTSKSPSLDSEVLLSFILNKSKEYLIMNHLLNITNWQAKKFLKLVEKRKQGWPVAYLTGRKEFYGLNFIVNKNVLIPRPETEGLIDLVLEKLKAPSYKLQATSYKILDLGTGSGCIILSLARSLSELEASRSKFQVSSFKFYASDISKKALIVAKQNTKNYKIKTMFKQGNLLKPWQNKSFDIIIANLPYGWKEWKNNTTTETIGLKFEPQRALFTNQNGLSLISKLLTQISLLKSPAKYIFLEFDPRQTTQIKKLVNKILPDYSFEIKKDLAKKNRFACLSL